MKPLPRTLIRLGLASPLASLALAIEPPEDNSPPPAPPPAQPDAQPPPAPKPEAKAAAAAYLGAGVVDMPEVLASHLGLDAGGGVVVRSIDPRGPAAKAGIVQHDVITRVAGQPVASHADLTREVQKHQPGAEIAIDFIHQGKPATKNATLVPRPDGAGIAPADMLDPLRFGGMHEEQAARLKEMIERQLKAFEGIPGLDALPDAEDPLPRRVPNDMDGAMQEMRKRMDDAGKQRAGGGIRFSSGATFRMMNPDGSSIELNSKDGGKEATLRGKDGKITWSGPWDTAQDKAAAPQDVREKLERLNLDGGFNGGLKFRLGGAFGNPDPDPQAEEEGQEDAAPDNEAAPSPKPKDDPAR